VHKGVLRRPALWQALPVLHSRGAAMVSCQARNAALALRPAVIPGRAFWREPGIHSTTCCVA